MLSIALTLLAWALLAQAESDAPPSAEPLVVARVGDENIHADEVALALRDGLRGRELADAARPRFEAEALDLVVDQRSIVQRLRREELAVGQSKIDEAVAGLRGAAERQGQSFEEFLRQDGMTEHALRRQLEWRLNWPVWLAANLTDEERQAYFDAHRPEFDGTELRVSHVLLAVDEPRTPATEEAAVERAAALRKQIVDGELTFAEAAERYSRGPSRRRGGDLGFVPRRGPKSMSEEFSAAAFALDEDDISRPVVSRFGVHLILRTDVRPGDKQAAEVREELDPHVTRHLFARLAAEERQRTRVEFTGAMPYLDPATGALVAAGEETRE